VDSEEEKIEEELGYISPLDNANPYTSFKQALTGTFSCTSRSSEDLLFILRN
jgi:hypothetical protein